MSLEEAARIYESMSPYDAYGVCEWQLGWYYERALIKAAKKLSKDKRLQRARIYYELSAQKGYAKAFNSLGNFTHYGWGGLSKNFSKTMGYYDQAANMGDIYAVMNCGLTCLKQYSMDNTQTDLLNQAQDHFKKAAQYGDIEGIFQLGIIYEIKSKDDSSNLDQAKRYYLEALKNVDNQYSATAYFKLGKMINRDDKLQSDSEIITALGKSRYKDLALECFTRAYEMYQKLDSRAENGERLFGQYRDCFNELIEIFKRI